MSRYLGLRLELELRQTLLNLVGNAIKFTDKGKIVVGVKHLTSQSENEELITCCFYVHDTGIGLDERKASTLFDAFHQEEHGAVSRRHKGTGLGLTIVKEFVERMGGQIQVEGKVGHGSRFYFTISFPSKAKPTPISNISHNRTSAPSQIVIVDDNLSTLESCRSIISSNLSGSDLSAVDQPSVFLQQIESNVPGIGGLTAAESIRKLLAGKSKPPLLCSHGHCRFRRSAPCDEE